MMSEKEVIYLSGPITGKERRNIDSFRKYEEELIDKGYLVINPHKMLSGDKGDDIKPRDWYMQMELSKLMNADKIAVIEGWQHSRGAITEVISGHQMGLDIVRADEPNKAIDLESVEIKWSERNNGS